MRRQLRLTLAQRQHAGIVPRCDTRLQLQPLQRTSLRTSGIRLKKRGARNSRPRHVASAGCPDGKPAVLAFLMFAKSALGRRDGASLWLFLFGFLGFFVAFHLTFGHADLPVRPA